MPEDAPCDVDCASHRSALDPHARTGGIPLRKPGETIGRIHSIESCGAVDGPGIRYLLFLQGCLMRCQYCHNRDTWDLGGGDITTVDQVMDGIRSAKPYIRNGGVTCSGGEPLLQIEFVIQLFRQCKAEGIHTCLDTNGYIRHCKDRLDALLEVTDLVLLDLKQLDDAKHVNLTRISNRHALDFACLLSERQQPMWIRHVVVPGYTDDEDSVEQFGRFVGGLNGVEKVELLPYHELGKHKWVAFGDRYELDHVAPPSRAHMAALAARLSTHGLRVCV